MAGATVVAAEPENPPPATVRVRRMHGGGQNIECSL
jgi:hypothetical protein